MKKFSVIALSLTLSFLMIFLSSCSFIIINDKNKEGGTTKDEDAAPYHETPDYRPEAEKRLHAIKRLSLSRNVTLACPDASYFVPEDISSDLDEARIYRNRIFEDYFGNGLSAKEMSVDEILTGIAESQKNGSFFADLIAIPASQLERFISAGAISNLASLPYTDFSADYYFSSATDGASAGNTVYAVAGSFCSDPTDLDVLYYNKKLISKYCEEDLISTAKDGELTWTYIFNIVSNASKKGYSGKSFAAPGYGYFTCAMTHSAGFDYVHSERNTVPVTVPPADEEISLLSAANNSLRLIPGVFGDGAINDFVAGNSLFCITTVGDMSRINRAELDFGVLPLPKLSVSSPQRTTLSKDVYVICAPALVTDPTISGIALQGLMASSYGFIPEESYSYLIMNLIRSSENLDMIDLARGEAGERAISCDATWFFNIEEVKNATSDAVLRAVFYGEDLKTLYFVRERAANIAFYNRFS